jgi:hypothetical protein
MILDPVEPVDDVYSTLHSFFESMKYVSHTFPLEFIQTHFQHEQNNNSQAANSRQ